MSKYSKGRAFEYRVRSELIAHGWYVIRSAGSHTAVDLVALREDCQPLAIQCKAQPWPEISRKEREDLRRLTSCGVFPVLAGRRNGKVIYLDLDLKEVKLYGF